MSFFLLLKFKLKAFLFMCQELSNDVECQIRGVIVIAFPLIGVPLEVVGIQPVMNTSVREIMNIVGKKVVPVRIAAMHICITDNPWVRLASALLLKALPTAFRLRSRVHIGTIDECCYNLLRYGIPGDQIPIKSSGIIKIADHKRFIAYCQEREDAIFRNRVEYKGIFCPYSKDVLVGRGPRVKHHIGNEMYRTLLQSKYEQYNSSTMTKKRKIAFEIIREVHTYGGRFLIPAKKCWMEADSETARAKVSIAFRDVRKTLNAKKNRSYNNSLAKELSAGTKEDCCTSN